MKKKNNIELKHLNNAILTTRESIAGHQDALRNLVHKLQNQLAEFHRLSTQETLRQAQGDK